MTFFVPKLGILFLQEILRLGTFGDTDFNYDNTIFKQQIAKYDMIFGPKCKGRAFTLAPNFAIRHIPGH